MNNFDLHEVYFIDGHGRAIPISGVKEINVEAEEEEGDKVRLSDSDMFYATLCDIDENRPFARESQNSAKRYKRNKAQYNFWKDQEFVGNNRAGRRRK